jgi:N-acetylmuramoyl-L-alanine amidase
MLNRRCALGRALAALLAGALAAGMASPAHGAGSARASYQQALARERALTAGGRTPTVRELRLLATAYERITRQYPTSGYADNALWQAAQLMLIVHGRTNQASDLERAIRLMTWLVREYPSSSLRRQARLSLAEAEAAVAASGRAARPPSAAPPRVKTSPAAPGRAAPEAPAPATTGTAVAPAASAAAGARTEPAEAAPPGLSGAGSPRGSRSGQTTGEIAGTVLTDPGATGPPAATLRDIRRTILPDVVRVTLELDREVPFRDERLEEPPRVFLDLQRTAPPSDDIETVRTYADDVVRQVRVGPRPDAATRVVLDLDGGGRHSVFTLYNPYRIVVDVQRPLAAGATSGATAAGGPGAAAAAEGTPRATAAGAPAGGGVRPASTALHTGPPAPDTVGRPWGRGAAPDVAPASARGADGREAAPQGRPGDATPAGETSREAARTPVRAAAPADPAAPFATASSDTPGSPLPSRPSVDVARPPATPPANSRGGYSIARQLGLGVSRIVIDPGHGGHDPGALGRRLTEAELVLDVALRLEKLLLAQPGFEVILTRRTDTFVPLEERTAIANRAGADLFLSIHANASRNREARGVETYYLNFASNTDAAEVAARENSASERSMHQLTDLVKAIALNNKLDESRDLAHLVQTSLVRRLRAADGEVRDLGVKQAPFVVLIGASMPSVLAEISFVTHPQEAQLLRTPAYRQRIAEALFDAIVRYQNTLKATRTTASQD